MIPTEESVVASMDGSDIRLFPFLPYLMQDLWEIGADPQAIIRLIRKHCKKPGSLRVLDLGCGKGAVSVKLAAELGCFCHGIDALPGFIDFAVSKAIEYGVDHLCLFETADIRYKARELSGYDVVVLGAIGPVFGNYTDTLNTLAGCLQEGGIFLIDDGYIEDESEFSHPLMLKKSIVLSQISEAGMELVENDVMHAEEISISDEYIFDSLKKRCEELMEKYPEKQHIFLDYIQQQEVENNVLETLVTCSTLVIRKRS